METKRNIKGQEAGKLKLKKPSLYNVIMYNDDFTTMEFVVSVLIKYFDKSAEEAESLMLTVHNCGKAAVARYTYDIANTKVNIVMHEARKQGFPFRMEVEKA